MKTLLLVYGFIILASIVDIIIKERIKHKYRNVSWSEVPNFWKDYISRQSIFRIRWVYALMGSFAGLAYYVTGWKGIILFLWFGIGMHEHVWYMWLKPIGRMFGWKEIPNIWFDLPDDAAWLKSAFWVRWIARKYNIEVAVYHTGSRITNITYAITPKVTLTLALLNFIIAVIFMALIGG